MKIAYLDCFSGISGDMMLGALIECGAEPRGIEEPLQSLGLGELRLRNEQVRRGALMGTRIQFEAPPQKAHRHLSQIRAMIERAELSPGVKQRAVAVFTRLGEVEAALHGATLEKVHFHEVGAVDSIADIVGNCLALELLGVDEMHCSALNVGGGTLECEHGTLPVPAPAALELLKGLPVYSSGVQAELVTPTGAALVSTLAASFGAMPAMRVLGSGYGAGTRELEEMPNLLRVTIGESVDARGESVDAGVSSIVSSGSTMERLWMLEANLDDMNPQVYGFFSERAFELGALDVFLVPVQMKKNRPGVLLSVLCRAGQRDALMNLFFQETTTLGVRCSEVLRRSLERESVEVTTPYGKVSVKVARENGNILNFSPEYEDCRRLASAASVPLRTILQEASFAFWKESGSSESREPGQGQNE